MKTTLEAKEEKARLLAEAFEIAKIDLRYEALCDELERENPESNKRVSDIIKDVQAKLNKKENSCVSLFFEENSRFDRLEEQGYCFEEIGKAVMVARRLLERAVAEGEITDAVFGECP